MTDWRKNLGNMLQKPAEQRPVAEFTDFPGFVANVAVPALQELAQELGKHGKNAVVRNSGTSASLTVSSEGVEELTYRIQCRMFPHGVVPFAEIRHKQRGGLRLVRSESLFRNGPPDYTIQDVTSDEIIRHFLDQYRRLVRSA